MLWSDKYRPTTLDDVTHNHAAAAVLKKMIRLNKFCHFILRGASGSGKRSLLRIFLNELDMQDSAMWINQGCLKTIESREKLYTFLDSKKNTRVKWLVVENLHKMAVNFTNILLHVLSAPDTYVCILETEPSISLSSWCIVINTHAHTCQELVSAGKKILESENIAITEHIEAAMNKYAHTCDNGLYTFLFLLRMYVVEQVQLEHYTCVQIDFDDLLFNNSLKSALTKLYECELQGYSHLDIATHLYKYVCNESKHIRIAIELGYALDHLTLHEHDNYALYASLSKIWMQQNPEPDNPGNSGNSGNPCNHGTNEIDDTCLNQSLGLS